MVSANTSLFLKTTQIRAVAIGTRQTSCFIEKYVWLPMVVHLKKKIGKHISEAKSCSSEVRQDKRFFADSAVQSTRQNRKRRRNVGLCNCAIVHENEQSGSLLIPFGLLKLITNGHSAGKDGRQCDLSATKVCRLLSILSVILRSTLPPSITNLPRMKPHCSICALMSEDNFQAFLWFAFSFPKSPSLVPGSIVNEETMAESFVWLNCHSEKTSQFCVVFQCSQSPLCFGFESKSTTGDCGLCKNPPKLPHQYPRVFQSGIPLYLFLRQQKRVHASDICRMGWRRKLQKPRCILEFATKTAS